MAELEASGEGERERRREVEAALQEASSIFKRELADKSQQLDLLRQEIRWGGGQLAMLSSAWCVHVHVQRGQAGSWGGGLAGQGV